MLERILEKGDGLGVLRGIGAEDPGAGTLVGRAFAAALAVDVEEGEGPRPSRGVFGRGDGELAAQARQELARHRVTGLEQLLQNWRCFEELVGAAEEIGRLQSEDELTGLVLQAF